MERAFDQLGSFMFFFFKICENKKKSFIQNEKETIFEERRLGEFFTDSIYFKAGDTDGSKEYAA